MEKRLILFVFLAVLILTLAFGFLIGFLVASHGMILGGLHG